MSYHPSSLPQRRRATSKSSPLPLVGALLSLFALLLAAIAVFLHTSAANAVIALLVCLFSLRVFFLWLGANKTFSSAQAENASSPAASWAMQGTNSPDGAYAAAGHQHYESQQAQLPAQYYQQPQTPPYAAPTQAQAQIAIRMPQPAVVPALAYVQGAAPNRVEGYAQQQRPAPPYVPIEEDAMFALDRPAAGERCFLLPKEGEPLVESQDRYALNSAGRCYAVADGVAGSFVPGPWARVVAQGFVERGGEFASKDDFQYWLADCSNRWQGWMEERWVPTMNALRQRNGDGPGDWSNDIRQGAQTTLVGCSLRRNPNPNDGSTQVRVCAIGDSEFFRFSPGKNGNWKLVEAFPFGDPAEFNARPNTLVSLPRADLLEMAWQRRKTTAITAYPGDLLVLASDTLAKWLLWQVQQGNSGRWLPLLACEDIAEFEQRIRQEFYTDRVEDDDVTMLIIPVAS